MRDGRFAFRAHLFITQPARVILAALVTTGFVPVAFRWQKVGKNIGFVIK